MNGHIYKVIFQWNNVGKYTTYLTIHPVGDFEDVSGAEKAAYEYVENVLGISLDQISFVYSSDTGYADT
jgi:hypothetical protein